MGATSRIQINLKMGIENLDFVEGRTDDLVLFKKKNECVCELLRKYLLPAILACHLLLLVQ